MPSIIRLALKACACAFLALALGACVLSAKAPLYADADTKLIFATPDVMLTAYSLKNGQWMAEEEKMALEADGQHYIATIEKSFGQIAFVPLEGNWYVAQMIEDKKPPLYTLVRDDQNEFHVFPIMCSAVKKLPMADQHIEFVKDDCVLKPGMDHRPLFKALSASPGADTLKLVPGA